MNNVWDKQIWEHAERMVTRLSVEGGWEAMRHSERRRYVLVAYYMAKDLVTGAIPGTQPSLDDEGPGVA